METRRAEAKSKNKSLKREASSCEMGASAGGKGKKLKGQVHPIQSKTAQKLMKLEDPSEAKIRPSYSVAKDPNASEVYKSLFTTHNKARNQTKAHWVTYNPFYN